MGYGFYFDPTYVLVIIGAVISMIASAHVTSTYRKYAGVQSRCGMTGAQAAQEILRRNGIYDVTIQHVGGNLTDHFDPRAKTVRLSDTVYGSTSVAALGVAAHECGHVVQDAKGYVPLRIRTALVPAANFGTNAGIWIAIIGIILGLSQTIVMIGVILFSLGVLFQLVTLPVEFNASHRALQMLEDYGMLGRDEVADSRKVLTAAALTYVAAALSSILQLLRLLLLARRNDRD
ncbi:MAG: zinc metallopeptidase [Lachnospiraceae bacterium]|jgi:Zn-dependent membrane protease YugP